MATPRIGIPRALLYYEYFPMWKTFFECLGSEVVLSPPTTSQVVASGSSRAVAETCLPVKVFIGHALSLVGKCDYVFVPAIRSMEKNIHNCSKFLGLPDMTKAVAPEVSILEVDIDVDKGKRQLYLDVYKLGRLFTWNPFKIKRAAVAAWQAHHAYLAKMLTHKQTPLQVLGEMLGKPESKKRNDSNPWARVGLVGHPYLLYDEHVNYRLFSRLKDMGVEVLFPERIKKEDNDAAIAKLVEKAYWTYEREIIGAGGYCLDSEVDGVIALAAFGCGPDSLMMDLLQRYAKRLRKPFMLLTLDEHTSETGLLTRLEAFLDMIYRRAKCV